jgi:hypothetical protein
LNRTSYALEFKDSITATNWSGVVTNTGNGSLLQLSDLDATTSQGFYRMRQW